MKEVVQRTFMGCVGHAGGLLDELRHPARLGNKCRVRPLDSLGRCLHSVGHEPLRFWSYTVVLL
jgi:hypothetical protein